MNLPFLNGLWRMLRGRSAGAMQRATYQNWTDDDPSLFASGTVPNSAMETSSSSPATTDVAGKSCAGAGGGAPIRRVALLEPTVASECAVTEMLAQIRCGAPFLAGALERRGFTCRVFAEELIGFDATLMDRIARDFDAVGLSLALNTLPRGVQVARALRHRRPDLPIAIGGPSASAFADRLLGTADAVFRGRAETGFPAWLETLNRGGDPSGIPGIVLRREGAIVRNAAEPVPEEGQTRYDLVEGLGPIAPRGNLFGLPKPAVYSLFASTGCVRSCRFCQSEKSYRRRSHEAVIEDLERLLVLHGDRGTLKGMMVDDCLFGNLDWTKELLRRIAHACRGHDVAFTAQFHVQPTADDEVMRLFREARFESLAIGFETVSQASLDHERKGTTVAENDRAIEQCRKHGIVPYGYFVTGFDTDDEATVDRVFSYILERKIVAQVLPVGLMSRDESGRPTPEAPRVLSDTSFGATVFVSHRPALMKASRLQELINRGYRRLTSLRRWRDFSTTYEKRALFGFNRCFAVWRPLMEAHVDYLRRRGE